MRERRKGGKDRGEGSCFIKPLLPLAVYYVNSSNNREETVFIHLYLTIHAHLFLTCFKNNQLGKRNFH